MGQETQGPRGTSKNPTGATLATTDRPVRTGHGPAMGAPAQKSLDFIGSGKRLLGLLAPVRGPVMLAVALTVVSVGLSVVGPKMLGRATDLIFAGVIGRQLPAGVSKDQAVAGARAAGQGTFADMLAAMNVLLAAGSTSTPSGGCCCWCWASTSSRAC